MLEIVSVQTEQVAHQAEPLARRIANLVLSPALILLSVCRSWQVREKRAVRVVETQYLPILA
jgi:hypothetical protein